MLLGLERKVTINAQIKRPNNPKHQINAFAERLKMNLIGGANNIQLIIAPIIIAPCIDSPKMDLYMPKQNAKSEKNRIYP